MRVPDKPIRTLGFFDSGQGGLTIWAQLRKSFPQLGTLYLGDNARYPYGTKSSSTVTRYATEAVVSLNQLGADAIVVACGTASSVAVPGLTSLFALPIVGITESMCRVAALIASELQLDSAKGKSCIATLATPYTVKSRQFKKSLDAHLNPNQASHWSLEASACPLFVPIVEEGFGTHSIAKNAVRHYLKDLSPQTRILLLGCTHFPRLTPLITEALATQTGRKVVVWNSGTPIDKDSCLIIEPSAALEWSLAADWKTALDSEASPESATHRVFCTDDPEGFERTARVFCEDLLPTVEKISISL